MADSDRVAELKRKMQESAQKAKADAAAKEGAAPAVAAEPALPATPPKPTATTVAPGNPAQAAASTPPLAAPVAVSAAVAEAAGIDRDAASAGVVSQGAAVAILAEESVPAGQAAAEAAAAANGSAAALRSSLIPPDPSTYVEPELSPEEIARRTMGRREFLTYAWGGSLALVGLATGVGTFQFMYPRFRAGEFGGKFFLGAPDTMPATDAAPIADPAGKFWLVNSEEEGIKAIYMVCTHLGCLYKWEPSTVRFECPCHGSKFTREGFYIEGPAPRSLDRFTVTEEEGQVVVDTGARITGAPAGESPARAA